MANGYVKTCLGRAHHDLRLAHGGIQYRINGDGSVEDGEPFLSDDDRRTAREASLKVARALQAIEDASDALREIDLNFLV